MSLVDTHAHLTFPELVAHVDEVLKRCELAGVTRIVTVGTDLADARRAVDLAERFSGRVFAAVGVHPHEADKVTDDDLNAIAKLWTHPCIVAAGEMGLDYHYDFADRSRQRDVFARQLNLASDRRLPIVIHAREAMDDTIAILTDHGFTNQRVVFHCFTGSADDAARIAEHGWRTSFTGIVTFKGSTVLQAIAKSYPADKLMVETDSPYLSPVPVRNKRPNEPAHVAHVARFLSELRGVSFETLAEQTTRNATDFYGLDRARDDST